MKKTSISKKVFKETEVSEFNIFFKKLQKYFIPVFL